MPVSDPVARLALKRVKSANSKRGAIRSPARLAVTLIAMIAFAFQSYVTQTHMHGAPRVERSLIGVAQSGAAFTKDGTGKLPPLDDPATCPICQDMLMVGHFISPAAIAALPPALPVSVVAFETGDSIAIPPVSHDWQGRGPPQA